MNFNSIKTTLLVAGLSASAFSSIAVSAETVKTARSNISTVQTESNSATDREFSPVNSTSTDTKFPNNPLLSQIRRVRDLESCIELYVRCNSQRPRPNCGACLAFCRSQGFWNFNECPITKRRR